MVNQRELKRAREHASKLFCATYSGAFANCSNHNFSSSTAGGAAASSTERLQDRIFRMTSRMTVAEYVSWWRAQGERDQADMPTPAEFERIREERLSEITGLRRTPRNSSLAHVLAERRHFSNSRCRHCSKSFAMQQDCSQHERQCGNRRCEYCSQVFKTPLQLRGHAVICDHNQNTHCEFCAMRIANSTCKSEHEGVCEANPALWCDLCGTKFPHVALKEKHARRCPYSPNLTCTYCCNRFPTRLETVLHQVNCDSPGNPLSRQVRFTDCACCREERQCIRFPCNTHYYCAMCLFRMARTGIKDRTQLPLKCCKSHVTAGDSVDLAVAQILSEADRDKYQEAMLLKTSKHVMYCPRADCGALIALDELKQAGVNLSGPGGCPRCLQALCYDCKAEWHAGMTCPQYQFVAARSKDAIMQICRDNHWMRCFECGHVVEKKAGCNHITCLCGNQFCYICGGKWGVCKCQVISGGHTLRHNRTTANALEHVCPHCRQPYPSDLELRAHIRICFTATQRNGGAFECTNCLRGVPNSDALRLHRRQCQWAIRGSFGCPECGVDLNDQGALRRHRRICGRVVAGC